METKLTNEVPPSLDEQGQTAPSPKTGRKYKVTFKPYNVTVEVDESQFPFGDHGKPGSLLDIALAHHVPMGHNCGGNCACTTCHVIVKEGMENLSPMEPDEEDRLDRAEGLTLSSRLGCQAVVKGDVVVDIQDEGDE
jgi:2Fe-2S ferredoxin